MNVPKAEPPRPIHFGAGSVHGDNGLDAETLQRAEALIALRHATAEEAIGNATNVVQPR
jgi:hypothetical protein